MAILFIKQNMFVDKPCMYIMVFVLAPMKNVFKVSMHCMLKNAGHITGEKLPKLLATCAMTVSYCATYATLSGTLLLCNKFVLSTTDLR